MAMSPAWKRGVAVAVQAAVSLSLLGWLATRTDFLRDVGRVWEASHPSWLVGGLVLAGIVQGLCLWRWRIFLKASGLKVGFREACGVYFAGTFAGLFLPGGAGGDVVKVAMLGARKFDAARAALSVVMDRLCGSVSMVLVGSVLILWHRDWLARSPAVAAMMNGILVYLLALAVGLVLTFVLATRGGSLPKGWPMRDRFVEITGAFVRGVLDWRLSVLAVAVSCGMLVLYFLTFFFSARACGLELAAGDFLALMPAVDILSGLPVSLGGFGVREATFHFLLGDLEGVAAAQAVAVSLTGYVMTALWALPGGVLWMWRSK